MAGSKPEPLELEHIAGLDAPLSLFTHDPASDLVSRMLHEQRCWEPFESRLWLACQQPNDVVVDVGANLGYFSLLSARHPNSPRAIFAFEPAPDNFALLLENLRLNNCEDAVLPVCAALGERDGNVSLYRNGENRGDHQVYAGDGERPSERVRSVDGARFMQREAVGFIDLLKVDVQGSEVAVMRGLLPMLTADARKPRMLIELTPYSLRLAGSSGRELISLLAQLALPMAIVDHQEERLVPCDPEALCVWSDNVDKTLDDRGFMNIFVGPVPAGLPVQ